MHHGSPTIFWNLRSGGVPSQRTTPDTEPVFAGSIAWGFGLLLPPLAAPPAALSEPLVVDEPPESDALSSPPPQATSDINTQLNATLFDMTFIRTTPPGEAQGRLKAIYDAAIKRAGKVYKILEIQSPNPAVLTASMQLYTATMFGPSPLSRSDREALAVVVSRGNECGY